jgi:hypothetical protein
MDSPIEGPAPCLVTRVGKLSHHHPFIGFWCCSSLLPIHPQSKSVFTTIIYLALNASSPAHPAMHLNKKIRSFPSSPFIHSQIRFAQKLQWLSRMMMRVDPNTQNSFTPGNMYLSLLFHLKILCRLCVYVLVCVCVCVCLCVWEREGHGQEWGVWGSTRSPDSRCHIAKCLWLKLYYSQPCDTSKWPTMV